MHLASCFRTALLAGLVSTAAFAHGGRYLGPGDTVPPPGGSSGCVPPPSSSVSFHTAFDWESDVDRGESDGASPTDDRVALLRFLHTKMDSARFGPGGGFDDVRVRAQVPLAVARLFTCDGRMPVDVEGALEVRALLVSRCAELAFEVRQKVCLRRSATIALGVIGEAGEAGDDGDDGKSGVNPVVFETLTRIVRDSPDVQSVHFALMALAEMGSRPGSGDAPWVFSPEVSELLTNTLVHGDERRAPWAGLALGVFGRAVLANGGRLDPTVRSALRRPACDHRTRGHGAGELRRSARPHDAGVRVRRARDDVRPSPDRVERDLVGTCELSGEREDAHGPVAGQRPLRDPVRDVSAPRGRGPRECRRVGRHPGAGAR